MKKVIILCSALVFDFLTCSDVSAAVDINSVNYQNAREAIEDELTELLKASNEKEVKLYINEFESRLNSSPKKAWLNSSEMTIKNGSVKFRDPKSKGYKSDPKLFRDYLSDVRKRINQLKAQTRSKRKPATSIPWASRTPQNMQNNTEQSQIEGRTSVDQRQHGDVDQFSALQRRNNVPEIEGRTSVDPRQPGDVDQFSASQRRNNVPEIEGDNQRRAPDSGDSEVNNSGNQNGWVNRENSNLKANQYMDHLEEAPIEDQEAWLNGEALRRNIENGSNAIDYAPPIQDYNLGGNSATIGGGGVPTLPGK